jgi:hypothetical protein
MKRVLLLSMACFIASVAFSQSVIFDGEDAGNPWWNVGQATVEVVNWLPKDAVNGSDYGATIWLSNGDDEWSGGGVTLNNLDISGYNKISIDVNKMVDGTVQVELQNGEARAYLQLPYTAAIVDGHGSWQTLVFDIPEDWTTLTALLVAPHLVNTTENPLPDGEAHRFSWDNVKAYNDGTTTAMETASVFEKIVDTKIYNLNGILLNTNDLQTLPQGVYLLKQTDDKGYVRTQKVVNVKYPN